MLTSFYNSAVPQGNGHISPPIAAGTSPSGKEGQSIREARKFQERLIRCVWVNTQTVYTVTIVSGIRMNICFPLLSPLLCVSSLHLGTL